MTTAIHNQETSPDEGLKVATQRVNAVVSELLQRNQLATAAGMQFGGKRDLYEVYGYKKHLVVDDFMAKYQRQDIAKRIVNAPAVATWLGRPKLDGGETFNKAFEELVAKFNFWSTLERLDKLAGLGRFAVLLIGLSDGANLESAPGKGRNRELVYLQPYSERRVSVEKLEVDASKPRFGQPKTYSLQLGDSTGTAAEVDKKRVHYLRLVHVAENLLDDNVYGTPRLEHVYNLLEDMLKVVGGAAEIFWLNARGGMQVDVDKDMQLDVDDANALEAELEEYMHQLRRVLQTRGVKINTLEMPMADPRGTFNVLISLISGATGIPQRVLLGNEAGHLSSEQDRANWASRVSERREDFAEPTVLRPTVDSLIALGILPEPEGNKYTIEWPSAFQMSPLEEAQMYAQMARSVANFSKQGQMNFPIMTQEEIRNVMGLPKELQGTLPPENPRFKESAVKSLADLKPEAKGEGKKEATAPKETSAGPQKTT